MEGETVGRGPGGEGSARRILLAAPGPALRRAARVLLEEAGYAVLEARDGIEALCLLSRERPALALLDRDCPGLDGFQLCALIKSREDYRQLPVMLMGDAEDAFEEARAALLDAACLLGKPFGREDLLEALGRAGGGDAL